MTDDKAAYIFGCGVYVGDEVPDSTATGNARMMYEEGVANPKIILDSGKVVWGCECWWGPEEQLEEKTQGREVVEVNIDDSRKQAGGLN